MFSFAPAPPGIIMMQPTELFAISAHPAFQGTFINAPPPPTAATATVATFNSYTPLTPLTAASILTAAQTTPVAAPPHHPSAILTSHQAPNTTFIPATNRTSTTFLNSRSSNSNGYYTQTIRRTRSGHVSKSKAVKCNIDLTKICPSCNKQWKLCACSNIKNRPAPKPYCKFVPPRMLNQKKKF